RVPFELLGRTNFPPIGEGSYIVTLGPYGFFWFLLREPDTSTIEMPRTWAEFETLVVTDGWRSLLRDRSSPGCGRDVLPASFSSRRGFADRGPLPAPHVVGAERSGPADADAGVVLVGSRGGHETANYLRPMTIRWTRFDRERKNPNALAAV